MIQDVFLGPIPYMTDKATFVINGAERVVVSQLHRSPGVFFGQSVHANGTKLYSARIIPFKGSWIEFATDINNVMYAYIDRKKKLPVTTLLRAIGFENDKDILEIFDLAEDVKVNKTNLKKVLGRKLAARVLKTWIEDFVDEDTGEVVSIERNEVIIDRETVLEEEHIDEILESGVQNILLHKDEPNQSDFSIIYNTLQKDPSNSEKEAVLYIYRQLRNADPADDASAREVINNLFFSEKRYDLGDVGRYRINKKLNLTTDMDVRVLTKEDIIEIIKYLIELINSKADVDDIDHLSNRRVRTVGEQLSNQFAVGLARMSRTIRERMNVRDNEVFTPIDLINAKTISSVINSFFGTNALSQFMDQTNPLAEITHKRRMSALGPGGLSRERAGKTLGVKFATPIFDGATMEDLDQWTDKAGLPRYCKTYLCDGGTGEQFDQAATVGVTYMLKLGHMVEDKMHARSIGPYSLITQQPLGGKAQFGGQRFGEMEVWALEGFGAAHILQEILTIKSDDVVGRSKAYEAIVKGEPMPQPGIPESLNVLLHELRGLGLSINLE